MPIEGGENMATIVNTPAQGHVQDESMANSGMNLLIGVITIAVVAFLLFYFGVPVMRSLGGSGGGNAPQQINQNNPPQGAGGNNPQINIPDKVNVDVNAPKQPGQ